MRTNHANALMISLLSYKGTLHCFIPCTAFDLLSEMEIAKRYAVNQKLKWRRTPPSTVANCCLSQLSHIAGQKGKGVHVVNAYVVATWQPPLNCDPFLSLPAGASLRLHPFFPYASQVTGPFV
ncbi:hypothetical protein Q8A67_013770 [Cirrhinus molitorella]|uniref:Uncharacterized protein n=1 Tax=Cirrhinus molitorella TaxID=172907 RepID=A0AA88PTY4_9TELE|nr:hypothetical protein Q8A67_013770 [Cirrhinus molitorella]